MTDGCYVREVGGELVSSVVADTEAAHIEVVRRRSDAPVRWRFQQPKTVLYWFRTGVRTGHLSASGRRHDVSFGPNSDLIAIPANCGMEGRFEAEPVTEYTIVFFDSERLEQATRIQLERPLVGFANNIIKYGLADIAAQVQRPGRFFEPLVHGWSLQTMALLGQLTTAQETDAVVTGGLSLRNVRAVQSYVAAHLSDQIGVHDLAALCGLSRRHFPRAFAESFATTPARYLADLRLVEAKRLLVEGELSIADISSVCGYAHPQHFATRFKASTGMTPSQFRTSALHAHADRPRGPVTTEASWTDGPGSAAPAPRQGSR
jgi:AraC family transcriptional regulator